MKTEKQRRQLGGQGFLELLSGQKRYEKRREYQNLEMYRHDVDVIELSIIMTKMSQY